MFEVKVIRQIYCFDVHCFAQGFHIQNENYVGRSGR